MTVTDDGNGQLSAGYVIDGNEDTVYAVFDNPYTPVPTEISIPVKKTVQGEPEADAVFTFTLSAADGVPMPDQPVVTITGAGTADIGPIEYTEAGTYTYTLQETDGAVPGFTYDTTPRTITVTVTDDHGRLSAVWAGSDPTAEYVEFINPYEPPHIALTVEKIWDDANDQDRIRPESITVTLHAEYTKDGVTSEVTLPAGIQTTVTITEADGWTYTWDALPKYKDLIYEIAYTVEEAVIAVPPGFNASYTPSYSDITYDSERGVYVIEITNPHVPETIDFDFTKVGEPLEAGEEAVPVALDGITFSLFTDEECTTPAMGTAADGSTFPLTAVSDADGVVTFQNLRYGVYYMKETDQGDHDEAYWDNNAVYTVTAAATGVTIEVNEADVEYTGALISDDVIENSLVRYEIEILKLDGKALRDDPDNEVPVEGAEFALYGADYLIENEDGDMEADPNAVPILTGITTDEEGKASLGSLTVGTYYLVETHAPVEYLLLEEPVEITVAEGEITVGEDVYHEEGDDPHRIVIRLTNEPKYGNLEIVKYLPTYEVDEPATFVFDVVATMGVDENGDPIVVYSNVAVLTFTKAGTLSTTLYHIPAGAEVVVTEVYSGSHYELTSAAESTVTIVASETVSVYFENDYIPYDRDGHGIVNVFDPDDSAAGWHWTPASSN